MLLVRILMLLQELISVAFTAATSNIEAMRPAGIITLIDLVDKFGSAMDPDYEGHLLLEQYHAQTAAALRPCFASDAEPSLAAAGCALASRYLLVIGSTANNHEVDPPAVKKLVALLLRLVTQDGLVQVQFPAFSEAAATMVRAAALQAVAELQQAAVQPGGYQAVRHMTANRPAYWPRRYVLNSHDHVLNTHYVRILNMEYVCSQDCVRVVWQEIGGQLQEALPVLRDCWLALLRDVSFLLTQHLYPQQTRRPYRPHLM